MLGSVPEPAAAPTLFREAGAVAPAEAPRVVVATEHARGPWDPGACHGGPVAAMLVRASSGVEPAEPDRWQLARITVELVRPVPVGEPLTVAAELERPGRNVSLVAATLQDGAGRVVARSRALRVRTAEVPLRGGHLPEPPFGPAGVGRVERPSWSSEHLAFHNAAVEMRFVHGTFAAPGPVSAWMRVAVPLLPGSPLTGPERAVATADFGNGVSSELDPDEFTYVNPDLTVHLLRAPRGEWIGMRSSSQYGPLGAGLAESALFDADGRVGRSVQSLLVAAR